MAEEDEAVSGTTEQTAEPDFLRQTAEFAGKTPDERSVWFAACAEEGRALGMTWGRYSVDDAKNPTMGLVEGWKVRPADEGPIRWQMTLANAPPSASSA